MRSIFTLASTAALLLATAQQVAGSAADVFKRASVFEKRRAGQVGTFRHPELAKRADKFLNDKTKPFAVNGTGLPNVTFDIGESYAGLLPITDDPNESRKLFFWFFPSSNCNASKEITVWFNGGPGCSSLSGLLTENGPFTWDAGTLAPVPNPYTWVNLTNMVWVEQPIGVGFTQGTPNITNEYELADQFTGFWKNFIDLFEMYEWKMYITGESYGGYYVPYVANGFIEKDDCKYYNLKGIAINDPIIGDDVIQQEVVILPFLDYWQNLVYLNESFRNALQDLQVGCGYDDYLNKYFTFPPPPAPFPQLYDPTQTGANATCDIFTASLNGILEVNPCYNLYHISETCPHPYSVLGIVNPGDYSPPGLQVYFNRTDVQKAINAPVGTNWMQCTTNNVFAGNGSDLSVGPAQNGVLKRVVEYTNNSIIGCGNLDMLLSTNGTIFALQNMTWNGVQGFSVYPDNNELYVPYHPEYVGGSLAGAGYQGKWREERGLTFYQVQLSGHELPGYAPGAAYRVIEVLLGRVPDLSVVGDFSTQQGDFQSGYNASNISSASAATYKSRFNLVRPDGSD